MPHENDTGMRYALIALLLLHGLIHLLGFVRAFHLAPVPQLTGQVLFGQPYGHLGGVLWMAVALACLVAATLVLLRLPAWPVILGAALLSQGLVLAAWPDARWGSLPNAVLVLVAVSGFAMARFRSESEALSHLAVGPVGPVVTEADLATLPPPVARWLRRAGAVGHPIPRSVRLIQSGGLRTQPGARLMPARAHQHFTTDPPAFVWAAEVSLFGLPIVGRDTWIEGRGRMLIRAAGLATLADVADEKIDQGALLRYLSELVWFPGAALHPAITWAPAEGVEAALGAPDQRARATLTWGERTGTAEFRFDAEGRVQSIHAQRYFGGGDTGRLEPWVVEITAWKTLNTFEIPVEGDVLWRLPAGDFRYFPWRVEAIEYDEPTND